MRPVDVSIKETYRFLMRHTPATHARVLEVGCGAGKLSELMLANGFKVVAIDICADAIAEAKRLGIDARQVPLAEFEDAPFDVVLFSRSLHHMNSLEDAISHADRLLKPSGRLIVEDFAVREVDEFTADWFYNLLSLLNACEALNWDERPSFGGRLMEGGGTMKVWRQEYAEDLPCIELMVEAIEKRFRICARESVPYLYRYLDPMVPDNDKGGRIAFETFKLEEKLGASRSKSLIGRRLMAEKL